MTGCGGNCSGCSGCGRALVLTEAELALLDILAQIPFLPVARRAEEEIPHCFEEGVGENGSLLLQCLEKKGLISLDYDKPLKGRYGPAYDPYPIRGSMALTQRGQQVLELVEYRGVEGEA